MQNVVYVPSPYINAVTVKLGVVPPRVAESLLAVVAPVEATVPRSGHTG